MKKIFRLIFKVTFAKAPGRGSHVLLITEERALIPKDKATRSGMGKGEARVWGKRFIGARRSRVKRRKFARANAADRAIRPTSPRLARRHYGDSPCNLFSFA